MDCPNIKDCQLIKLKDDLGLIVVDKDYDIGKETIQQVEDRFSGIEPFVLVRDCDDSGLGRLYFRGVFICDTLENPAYLMPVGTYPLEFTFSPKFKVYLPEIIIPNHSGVRLHQANSYKDLKGCFGVGVRLSEGALLAYSNITLDRVKYIIKQLQIRYFKIT